MNNIKTIPDYIGNWLISTYNNKVHSNVGDYAGLYEYEDHFLVSSTDGVGTKIYLAKTDQEHEGIGKDLVNHCINDILVYGAKPLFFTNCFSYSTLHGESLQIHVTKGMALAAKEVDMPIITGETAKMEGYFSGPNGYYDLAGTIIGKVDKKKIINGRNVKKGDILIGLSSNGLHTNGFTLLRQVFNPIIDTNNIKKKWEYDENILMGVREAALKSHRSYYDLVNKLIEKCEIRAMAHITGGGIESNLNRVLNGYRAEINWDWKIPVIFSLIQEKGNISDSQMRQEFNCGIGYVLVVSENIANSVINYLDIIGEKPTIIGKVSS